LSRQKAANAAKTAQQAANAQGVVQRETEAIVLFNKLIAGAKTIADMDEVIERIHKSSRLSPGNKTNLLERATRKKNDTNRKNASAIQTYLAQIAAAQSTNNVRKIRAAARANQSISNANRASVNAQSQTRMTSIREERTRRTETYTKEIENATSPEQLNTIKTKIDDNKVLFDELRKWFQPKILAARSKLKAAAERNALATNRAAGNAENKRQAAARRKSETARRAKEEENERIIREATRDYTRRREVARVGEEARAAAQRAANRVAQNKKSKEAATLANNSKLRKLKSHLLTPRQKTNVNAYIEQIKRAGKQPNHTYNVNKELSNGTSRQQIAQFIVRHYRSQAERLYGATR
jgi:hypothetical protein